MNASIRLVLLTLCLAVLPLSLPGCQDKEQSSSLRTQTNPTGTPENVSGENNPTPNPETPQVPPEPDQSLPPEQVIIGSWQLVGLPPLPGGKNYRRYVIFTGNRIDMKLEHKVMQTGTYSLDTSTSPYTITTKIRSVARPNQPGPEVENTAPIEISGNTIKMGEGDELLNLKRVLTTP